MLLSTERIVQVGTIGLSASATLAVGQERPACRTRTEAQREALVRLVEDLRLVFPSLKQVIGHRDTSPDLNGDGIISPDEYIKSCPCFDVKAEFIQ